MQPIHSSERWQLSKKYLHRINNVDYSWKTIPSALLISSVGTHFHLKLILLHFSITWLCSPSRRYVDFKSNPFSCSRKMKKIQIKQNSIFIFYFHSIPPISWKSQINTKLRKKSAWSTLIFLSINLWIQLVDRYVSTVFSKKIPNLKASASLLNKSIESLAFQTKLLMSRFWTKYISHRRK